MKKSVLLIVLLLLSFALFAAPSTVTFSVTSTIGAINQISIKGVGGDSEYGESVTFNLSAFTTVEDVHVADLKYTTNLSSGVNLGISGQELISASGNIIPYTLSMGVNKDTVIKIGYGIEDNQSTGVINTPSPITQLYSTVKPIFLTILGNPTQYPAGAYSGTITFTLGAN